MENMQLSTGCYIDGHWGHYGPARLIQIANEMDWDNEEAAMAAHKYFHEKMEETDWEHVYWLSEEAETWLNDNRAPEGYWFGWDSGEFFLWSIKDWSEE